MKKLLKRYLRSLFGFSISAGGGEVKLVPRYHSRQVGFTREELEDTELKQEAEDRFWKEFRSN